MIGPCQLLEGHMNPFDPAASVKLLPSNRMQAPKECVTKQLISMMRIALTLRSLKT